MKSHNFKRLFTAVSISVFCFSNGCGTVIGNGLIDVKFKSYETQSMRMLTNVSDVKICPSQVRFIQNGESTATDISFASTAEVSVSASGTTVGTASVPNGTYTRIEIDLTDACTSKKSIQATNPQGNFTSSEKITLSFTGSFVLSGNGSLTLSVQPIMESLGQASSDGDLKGKAEQNNGSFGNGDFNN